MPATKILDYQINSDKLNSLYNEVVAARGSFGSVSSRFNDVSSRIRNITIAETAPTNEQGNDGDIWFVYIP